MILEKQSIKNTIIEHIEVVSKLTSIVPNIKSIGEQLVRCLNKGGKIVWMGNGGSAADSQHLAAELVGRYQRERQGLASIALTTDSSILTAVSNDYGYETVFARQIQALCTKQDIVIGISTSGNSKNIINGIKAAKDIGIYTVALLGGSGGALKELVDLSLIVPSDKTARIQEAHILIGHILCEMLDESIDTT